MDGKQSKHSSRVRSVSGRHRFNVARSALLQRGGWGKVDKDFGVRGRHNTGTYMVGKSCSTGKGRSHCVICQVLLSNFATCNVKGE